MAVSRQSEVFRIMASRPQVDEIARRQLGRFVDAESPYTWVLGNSNRMVLIDVSEDPDSINLMDNIRFFLFMELLGMGPDWYCVRYRPLYHNFVDYLTQVLTHLPRDKMFLYPVSRQFNSNVFPREMSIQLRVLLRQPTITDTEYLTEFED